MEKLLDKISSYNLFNYLLPGVLFVVILNIFTIYKITLDNLIVNAFLCYFIGLVISRFGSLFVEPLLKKISFLKFVSYSDFVSASKKDPTIEILSEANNMYRTFSSMFILIVLLKIYEWIGLLFPVISKGDTFVLVLLLLTMFLFSYRKQTKYIVKRIKANNT
jgi:hypothetical protein